MFSFKFFYRYNLENIFQFVEEENVCMYITLCTKLKCILLQKVEQILKKHDPEHEMFELLRNDLDIEIAVKNLTENNNVNKAAAWSKRDGVEFLFNKKGRPEANSKILLCGDTTSDIPMLR